MQRSPLSTVRACLEAFAEKDRAALEALIAEDYHFTSPLDNGLDRKAYFDICWPNSKTIAGFEFLHCSEDGDLAFVTYEGRTVDGKTFRNCEVHTVRNGQLTNTEVYFGWNVPHRVPHGEHAENRQAA
jgi:ketosteroid isomerase-like protein